MNELAFTCPVCKAGKGDPCISLIGRRPLNGQYHIDRKRLLKRSQQEAIEVRRKLRAP